MILHLLLLSVILSIITIAYWQYQHKYKKLQSSISENKEGIYCLKNGLIFDSIRHILYNKNTSFTYKLNNQQSILLKLFLDANEYKLQAWDAVDCIWGKNGNIENLYPLISRLRSQLKQIDPSIQILSVENGKYHLLF